MSLTFAHPLALSILLLTPALLLMQGNRVYASDSARRVAIGLRVLVLAALALALARPFLAWPDDRITTVFLLDASGSSGVERLRAAQSWVDGARRSMRPADGASVVVFGTDPGPGASDSPLADGGATRDLATAIRLAEGLLPPTGHRQVVLLTDGHAGGKSRREEAAEHVRRLSIRGIELDVVLLPTSGKTGGARVVAIDVPARVREGEAEDVAVVVESEVAGAGRLRFWTDGELIADQQVELASGRTRLVVGRVPDRQGYHRFRARVDLPGDPVPENDELDGYAVVVPRARVLVVAGPTADAEPLRAALNEQGMMVTVHLPEAVPPRVTDLVSYDAVVLDNVPAAGLSPEQMKALESFVRDHGRGLVNVGGDRSYAPGGYSGTVLDGILPVSSKVPMVRKKVPVALLLLIDTSESMARGNARDTKIAMAKGAAAEAVAALEDDDQVGVMIFDTRARVVVPFQRVGEAASREGIRDLIGRITPGGGTNIHDSLRAGFELVRRQDSAARHAVILTDGRVYDYRSYDELVQGFSDERITLSGIAVGDDADAQLMRWLSERGGGRYYFTGDPSELPRILTEETRLANRPSVVDVPFEPLIGTSSPLLRGLPPQLPRLGGYVLTSPKPMASVPLVSPQGDAVLAQWQYGLGRVVAWTSDAGQRWSGDWLRRQEFARLWSQTIRWTLPSPLDRALSGRVEVIGDAAKLVVEAAGPGGEPLSLRTVSALVVRPDGSEEALSLSETGPGIYEGQLRPVAPGSHVLWVGLHEGGRLIAEDLSGFVVSYPPEYADLGIDREAFRKLAQATGGKVLEDPAHVFDRAGGSWSGGTLELWPYLALLSLALFLVDVSFRMAIQHAIWRRGRGPRMTD